jgi:mismatch-specific thymine-DNA glycosylase
MCKQGFQQFIRPNLILLFVGFNPVEISLQNGHYFSSFPSCQKKSLWYQLHHAGFSEQLYSEFEADVKLFGNSRKRLGITDLVDDVATTKPNELTHEDIIRGRSRLNEEIHIYKPKVVCFLGKETYRKFQSLSKNRPVEYGIQKESIGESKIYLAAFPSSMEKTLGAFKSSMKKTLVSFTLSMENTQQKIEILKDLYQLYKNYLENGA